MKRLFLVVFFIAAAQVAIAQLSSPTFSIAPGVYTSSQTVGIGCPVGATCCVTIDGSTPAASTPGTCSNGSSLSSVTVTASEEDILALATEVSQTNSPIAGASYYIGTTPVPPQVMLASDITSGNFPTLVPAPAQTITVKASGGTYSSVAAAMSYLRGPPVICDTIVVVDDASTGFETDLGAQQFLNLTVPCPAGHLNWLQPSGLASLPAQDTDTQSYTAPDGNTYPSAISVANRNHMWKVVKTVSQGIYNFDGAITICGNNTVSNNGCSNGSPVGSGLIISGLDLEVQANGGGSCTATASYSGPETTSTSSVSSGSHVSIPVVSSSSFVVGDQLVVDPSGSTDSTTIFAIPDGTHVTATTLANNHGSGVPVYMPCPLLYAAISIGDPGNTTAATNPSRIWLDRVMVNTVSNAYDVPIIRGVDLVCTYCSITDSFIDHDWTPNYLAPFQGQGIVCPYGGCSYLKVVNNIDTGTPTENLMFGGADQLSSGNTFDVENRRNLFTKSPSMMGTPSGSGWNNAIVANLTEYKVGVIRVLDDANIRLYSYGDYPYYFQYGNCVKTSVDTAVTDNNGLTQRTSDILMSNEIMSHCAGMQFLGHAQSGLQYPALARVTLTNFLLTDQNEFYSGNANVTGFTLESAGINKTGYVSTSYLPGPWYVRILNGDIVGVPSNAENLTNLANPLGCVTPGDTYPFFTFHSNIVVTDGNSGAGNETLQGRCSARPYTLFANGVFPNVDWGNGTLGGMSGTSNFMFNFNGANTTGYPCDSTDWNPYNSSVGQCPQYLASSPTNINSITGMSDYQHCADGSSVTACGITGTYSTMAFSYSAYQTAAAITNDAVINGVIRVTGPAPPSSSTCILNGNININGNATFN